MKKKIELLQKDNKWIKEDNKLICLFKEKIEIDLIKIKQRTDGLEQDNTNLNKKITELEIIRIDLQDKNKDLMEEIEFNKQREIERIQQLDLDDIDIISQSSNYGRPNKVFIGKNVSKPNPLVPKLDFTKIFEWRNKENNQDKKNVEEVKQEFDEDIQLSHREDFISKDINIEGYQSPTSIESEYK